MPTREEPQGGRATAEAALGKLLDRFERLSDRQNRIMEALPRRSLLSEDRSELFGLLRAAEKSGAVELVFGRRDNSHNIEKVILVDPAPLYPLLGRRMPREVAKEAGEAIRASYPDMSAQMADVVDAMVDAWSSNRNLIRDLPYDAGLTAVRALKAAAALAGRNRSKETDIRTFSSKETGSSKFLENNIGKVAEIVRMLQELPEYLDKDELLEYFGVRRFVHPCLIAGPITYKGMVLPTKPFIGIAPEMVSEIGLAERPDWILTIENLASFNRQVREAAGRGVVIYTGGFPSQPTITAIVRLASSSDCPILHWGDIDAGGIKIAYLLEKALASISRKLRLHLMDPGLALAHGSPTKPVAVFRVPPDDTSAVADLATFIASEAAHFLEQEDLDPIAPVVG